MIASLPMMVLPAVPPVLAVASTLKTAALTAAATSFESIVASMPTAMPSRALDSAVAHAEDEQQVGKTTADATAFDLPPEIDFISNLMATIDNKLPIDSDLQAAPAPSASLLKTTPEDTLAISPTEFVPRFAPLPVSQAVQPFVPQSMPEFVPQSAPQLVLQFVLQPAPQFALQSLPQPVPRSAPQLVSQPALQSALQFVPGFVPIPASLPAPQRTTNVADKQSVAPMFGKLEQMVDGLATASPLPTATVVAVPATQPTEVSSSDATGPKTLDLSAGDAWLDGLARDIAATATPGGRLRFALVPENLGRLDIEVMRNETSLGVQVAARNEMARDILSAAQPRIVEEIRAQGVRIATVEISSELPSQGDFGRGARAAPPALVEASAVEQPATAISPRNPQPGRYA